MTFKRTLIFETSSKLNFSSFKDIVKVIHIYTTDWENILKIRIFQKACIQNKLQLSHHDNKKHDRLKLGKI